MQQEIWFSKYRIIGLLGRGGTAGVYLAEHIKLGEYRAIKCLPKDGKAYDYQLKEAQILKSLKHSCIPIIYDIEEDEECSYIVEQYLEGISLKEFVNKNGRIGENIIIHFALQICDLIQFLHSFDRPVLYLDLKPENIIVSDNMLKLVDFGSAQFMDELRPEHGYYGTRGYAAPEMYTRGKVDERSDIYGIGMLMYYMLTGRTDFNSFRSGLFHMNLNCSKEIKRIIFKCLRYNPSQRFASVTRLINQLSAYSKKCGRAAWPGRSIRVAVAGALPRIGVTHMSFRLCSYLTGAAIKIIYRERNDSRCIWSVKSRYDCITGRQDVFKMQGIPMLRNDQISNTDTSEYQVVIDDFGCLSDADIAEFINADIKILLLGAKDWELTASEQVLDKVAEYKDVVYLFNYLDGRQFQLAIKHMDSRACFRIPYEPDPFAPFKDDGDIELYGELAAMCLEKSAVKESDKGEKKTNAAE